MTTIGKQVLSEIEHHARECYPEECCGVVLEVEGRESVRPITNIQNRLHSENPAQYPRDARLAYFMDPGELAAVLREVEEGHPLRLFYHSHPDHDAYFSDEDKAAATPFGEPSYPDARYLVVSVREGRVVGRILVAWDPETADFVERPLTVV